MAIHDAIDKTGSTQCIATPPKENRDTQHTGQNLAKVGPVIPEIGPIHGVRVT